MLEITTITTFLMIIFLIVFGIVQHYAFNILDRLELYLENKHKKEREDMSPEGIYKQFRSLSTAIGKIPANDDDVVILLADFRRLGCIGGINGKTGSALVQLIKLVNKIVDRCETEDKEKAKKLVIEAVKRM